ncbi:MAG: Ldh family oxidoreductase [Treponema sp.]|jgi:LDH2 family malate/lactate/ureidoglycolate dehydrogenase|nr:Ldh family oxidoreductase [Treponema sp.]
MKIELAKLKATAIEILRACGESCEGAETVAASMVKADARGITTHGTHLLVPVYDRVQAKQLPLPTAVSLIEEKDATIIVDGGDGLGAIAGKQAVESTAKKAKQFGVATALIRNTNNVGSLACYTEAAAAHGMIAFMCCNAASAMSPWGGAEAWMGTNPIAIAIYTGGDIMFSADMASSVVARGKIRKAARNGQAIPSNWAMDADGNITTDPTAALKGCLLPMGGPKGSALALAVDIIAGLLSGASYAAGLKSFHTPCGSTGVGAALTVINIENFMPLDKFTSLIQGYIANMKALKKAAGQTEIFLPGEIEQRQEKKAASEGIDLDAGALEELKSLLEKIGSKTRLE